MVHILCGNASQDVDELLKAGSSGKPLRWIVPKKAVKGDRALFHLPRLGFTARGVIRSRPRQTSEGRYGATVRDISLLASSVPLAFVRTNHPRWKWPTYPRAIPPLMMSPRNDWKPCSPNIKPPLYSRSQKG